MAVFKPDPQQQEAASHYKGPALVLAPPGSGKTAVLTQRTAALVTDMNVPPERILVITFTRDAAESMARRFMSEQPTIRGVTFSTFHSFYYSILRSSGRISDAGIITQREKIPYIKKALAEEGISLPCDNESLIAEVSAAVSYYLNTGVPPKRGVPGIPDQKLFGIVKRYQTLKLMSRVIDLDDMIYRTYEVLKEDQSLCMRYQNKYDFVLIDEAQDMNGLQYSIIKLLAGRDKNIFMVGDDDQSIYGFRGADPGLLFTFKNDFPDTKVYYLKTNYRCDRSITLLASGLIGHNNKRFKKEIIPFSKNEGRIFLMESSDGTDEAQKAAAVIGQLLSSGVSPEGIAVLYRRTEQARELFAKLVSEGVPVLSGEKFEGGYDDHIRRDVMTYIRLALGKGQGSRKDFLHIINKPGRFLPGFLFDREEVVIDELIKNAISENDIRMLNLLKRDLIFMSSLPPAMAMVYLKKGVGYGDYLSYYSRKYNKDAADIFSRYEKVAEEAGEYRSIGEFMAGYEKRLREEEIIKESNKTKKSPEGKVSFHTFHGSKGLEFDNVIMLGCCEGDTPSSMADSIDELEEERRMFYVAMTRARHALYISVTGRRANRILYPSRFIKECGCYSSKSSS